MKSKQKKARIAEQQQLTARKGRLADLHVYFQQRKPKYASDDEAIAAYFQVLACQSGEAKEVGR